MKLKNKELIDINGGGFSASYINAAARAFNTILNFGRTVGSSIRRVFGRNWC